jgi:hypothetical protein
VRHAFEAFLILEGESWKGARGTALLSRPADAGFARRLIAALAEKGAASVALLRLEGTPIAAQVLLYSGRKAYTWKTAFDAAHAKHSPGVVLVDRITEELFASGIQAIESCSPETGFMAQLWEGRRGTLDVLLHVGARRSARVSRHRRRAPGLCCPAAAARLCANRPMVARWAQKARGCRRNVKIGARGWG